MNTSGVLLVDAGIAIVLVAMLLALHPWRAVGISSRWRAAALALAGVGSIVVGWALPAPESRTTAPTSQLDRFMPAWQFSEVHTRRIAAPPNRVYEAIGRVRADEIFLFDTLIAIRRGFRPMPPGILNAAGHESLIDIATRTTFVRLVDDRPHELVVGTVIIAPRGARGAPTPQLFRRDLPPGFALATMNFQVTADAAGGSIVRTETRVYANDDSARRRFAAYWRTIYPGSALIRVMWLRAIERRATT